MAKYSDSFRFRLQNIIDTDEALGFQHDSSQDSVAVGFAKFLRASIAASSWKKYESGWNAFCAFEKDTELYFDWPLPRQAFRAFAVWCSSTRNLQPSTIKAYLSAVRFAHQLKGLPCEEADSDPLLGLLITGARNLGFGKMPTPTDRRVVTFHLLLTLGHKIASSDWDSLSKQVVWTVCTVGFFTSARMGELLSGSTSQIDPTADLTWQDVRFNTDGSVLIHLKIPKSGDRNGEFLDVFPFPGFNCCPALALKALWKKQQEAGLSDKAAPVFRFRSGKNLTPRNLNSCLSELLSDLCGTGNKISCHSFRAGVPSTLSVHPELANSDEIKGWGRWNSECYTRYARLKHEQKEKIFTKIADILRKSI